MKMKELFLIVARRTAVDTFFLYDLSFKSYIDAYHNRVKGFFAVLTSAVLSSATIVLIFGTPMVATLVAHYLLRAICLGIWNFVRMA